MTKSAGEREPATSTAAGGDPRPGETTADQGRRSRLEQGLSEYIDDPAVVAGIAEILRDAQLERARREAAARQPTARGRQRDASATASCVAQPERPPATLIAAMPDSADHPAFQAWAAAYAQWYVKVSRVEQGLPAKVQDPAVYELIAEAIRETEEEQRRRHLERPA